MSLLLDALKKAAADKEKASAIASNTQSTEEDKVAQESEELTAVADDVFAPPEIDETLLTENDAEVTTDQLTGNEEVKSVTEEELELELPEEFEIAEEHNAAIADAVVEKETAEVVIETDIPKEPGITEDVEPAKVADVYTAVAEQQDNSKSEQSVGESVFKALPEYNPNDARKILKVSQKRYRNKQRMMYYGMYAFSALLFFIVSYLYFTAESLDNSKRPVFRPNTAAAMMNKPTVNDIGKTPDVQPVVAEQEKTVVKNQQKTKSVAANKPAKEQSQKITIVKQKKLDPISVLLQKAYQHYQAAEYADAEKLYQQVLGRDKRQRDALLGRAAIAVVNKQLQKAKDLYQQVRYYYPDDSIAKTALVDLLKKEISIANESELNLLLRENPEAAHVHFSLGLLYARQNRIKESQQSFFDAFVIEKKADYAYNLAVTLDKLGQQKAALSYYQQASVLADKSNIHFNEKHVLQRIEQLEAAK